MATVSKSVAVMLEVVEPISSVDVRMLEIVSASVEPVPAASKIKVSPAEIAAAMLNANVDAPAP